MKKIIISAILFTAFRLAALACPACERNQPKILKGVTHGAGAQSNWDYVGIIAITIIALLTLFFTIKWLIKPGEKNADHIKFSIIN